MTKWLKVERTEFFEVVVSANVGQNRNYMPPNMSRVKVLATFEIKDHQAINLQLSNDMWQKYLRTIENFAMNVAIEQVDGRYQVCTHDATGGVPWDYFWKRESRRI